MIDYKNMAWDRWDEMVGGVFGTCLTDKGKYVLNMPNVIFFYPKGTEERHLVSTSTNPQEKITLKPLTFKERMSYFVARAGA